MKGFHGGYRHGVRDNEQGRKLFFLFQQAAGTFVGSCHVEVSGLGYQVRVQGDAVFGQRLAVAVVAQLADGVVMSGVQEDGDLLVALTDQDLHRPAGFRLVIDGDGGVGVLIQTAKAVGERAADERNIQRCRLLRCIVEAAAQQDETPEYSELHGSVPGIPLPKLLFLPVT